MDLCLVTLQQQATSKCNVGVFFRAGGHVLLLHLDAAQLHEAIGLVPQLQLPV